MKSRFIGKGKRSHPASVKRYAAQAIVVLEEKSKTAKHTDRERIEKKIKTWRAKL